MSDPDLSQTQGKSEPGDYEPPALEVIGSVEEVTQGDFTGPGELGNFSVSDRALKQRFEAVDRDAVLAAVAKLPLERWSYWGDESGARHIGPMAQDFAKAFEVGSDERRIHTADAGGVALAAIQALERRLRAQEQELEALRAQLEQLG